LPGDIAVVGVVPRAANGTDGYRAARALYEEAATTDPPD
jgi:hypothetical protein